MEPLGTLGTIYLVSGGMGALYVIGSFLMGAVEHGDGDGVHADGGDGVHVDAGDGVHVDAGDGVHVDAGDGVHVDAGDGVDIDVDAGDGVHADGGDSESHTIRHEHLTTDSAVKAQVLYEGPASVVRMVTAIFSPMSFALFCTFFGATGLLLLHWFPVIGAVSLAPALVVGVIFCNIMRQFIHILSTKLESTSHAKATDAIGMEAEVLIPIEGSKTGEVVYVIKGKRYNSPAKVAKPGLSFKRGSKAIITGMKGHIVLIEPYENLLLSSSDDDLAER